MGLGEYGGGKDLEGDEAKEMEIRLYCMKFILFSIKQIKIKK